MLPGPGKNLIQNRNLFHSVPNENMKTSHWIICKRSCTTSEDFSVLVFFGGFSIYIISTAGKNSEAEMGGAGGVQRPFLPVKGAQA